MSNAFLILGKEARKERLRAALRAGNDAVEIEGRTVYVRGLGQHLIWWTLRRGELVNQVGNVRL